MQINSCATDHQFPITSWTLISQLRSGARPLVDKALSTLCERYYYPIYAYIRRSGFRDEDAKDATQDFFSKLLRLDVFGTADADKGRLRALLLKSLKRFLINWRIKDENHKPQLLDDVFPQAAQRFEREILIHHETPERIYLRTWAREIIELATKQLRTECASNGKLDFFRAVRPALLDGGSLRGHSPGEIAAQLGMSEAALRMGFSRLLGRFQLMLRATVAETLSSEAELESEMQALLSALQPDP